MKTQITHTAGPWQIEDCTPEDTNGMYEGLRYRIFADGYNIAKTTDGHKQALANARLIAAAPDMFALLERIAKEPCDHGAMLFCPREEARAAIAKARGS